MLNARSINRRRLFAETLECRNLLAGNVTAYTAGGDLFINGDDASNVITIESYRPGVVQVRGFNDSFGNPTVVNQGANALRLFYGLNGDIVVHMNGGNDQVRVTNLVTTGSLTIDMGPGYDQLGTGREGLMGAAQFGNTLPGPLYVQGSLNITTGSEIDGVYESDTHVAAVSSIDLGTGDDTLTFQRPANSGANVEYFNDLTISPQEGNDVINVTGLVSHAVTINDKSGPLSAQMTSMDVYGTLKVVTAEGADNVRISATNVRGDLVADTGSNDDFFLFFGIVADLKLNTGDGNDTVQVNSSSADEVIINLGRNNDTLDLAAIVARIVTVHGDDGDDTFTVSGIRAQVGNFYGDKNFDVYREPIVPPNEIPQFMRYTIERVDTF